MSGGRLTSISLERFKSYEKETVIELAPLTVILGRNNSGKSTIIQAILLLKQTLMEPRPEVPIQLTGTLLDALSLRELTYGWPESAKEVPGPRITVRWSSRIDVSAALEKARLPDIATLASNTGLSWLEQGANEASADRETELMLDYAEVEDKTVLRSLGIRSYAAPEGRRGREPELEFSFARTDQGTYSVTAKGPKGRPLASLQVELDHFLPHIIIDRRNIGRRDAQRSWYNAYLVLVEQPLDDLKAILSGFGYLGSMRSLPQTLYRPAAVPPEEIGASGEYAAQMLHARRADEVHYLAPLRLENDRVIVADVVRSQPLTDAVNEVLKDLGVHTALSIKDIKELGFRLLFGQASLQHVGRGISYLLPVVQLGLIADRLKFRSEGSDLPLAEYQEKCDGFGHCAFEEPEAHVHPKVQSRLAHWFVALAMARREVLVETHSDHVVRRLRGLAARAANGSDLERWLLENVRILEVDQVDGRSTVKTIALTPGGKLESWPADFMDEATDEERAIYFGSVDKSDGSAEPAPGDVLHDVGEEPDTGP